VVAPKPETAAPKDRILVVMLSASVATLENS